MRKFSHTTVKNSPWPTPTTDTVISTVIGYSSGACIIAIEAALLATYSGTNKKAGLAATVAMLFAYITT
jgi:hypothetical protein